MAETEIIKLDKKVAVIEQKIDNLSDKIADYQADNKEDHKAVRDLIIELDNKKAGVWVEDAMKRLNWVVILAVLGGILTIILK
jgi:uncharacterized coiled-coil protein SlyX